MRAAPALRSLVSALVLAAGTARAAESEFDLKVGAKAPPFSVPVHRKGGERVSLNGLLARGDVVVLSFFNTACKPCIKEIPKLTEVVRSMEGWPLATYIVSVGTEDGKTLQAFLDKHGFTLPVLLDKEGAFLGEAYGVVLGGMAQVPRIVVIGKNGDVKAYWKGFHEGMETRLAKLLDEAVSEAKAAKAPLDAVTVLFTNNTNGSVGAAPGESLGGLARRASLVKRERAGDLPVVLLDAGDFFPTSPDELRSRQVVAAYDAMNYDAVTFGEGEFVNGLKFLRDLLDDKRLRVPFVSANVKRCQGDDCTDLAGPSLVVAAGKRKVAVFGYLHAEALGFTPRKRLQHGDWKARILDYKSALAEFVERHRKQADLLVVLSHAGLEADRKLAQEFKDIDLIVGGHSQTFMTEPAREGDTFIAQAESDGKYVGKITLKFANGARPALEAYELLPVAATLPEDTEVKAHLAKLEVAAAAREDAPPEP